MSDGDIYLVTGEGTAPLCIVRAFNTLDEAKEFVDEDRERERWGNDGKADYIGWKWRIRPIKLGRYSDGT